MPEQHPDEPVSVSEHIGAHDERVADDCLGGETTAIDDGLDCFDDHIGYRRRNPGLDG
jgi:hypothetical protein